MISAFLFALLIFWRYSGSSLAWSAVSNSASGWLLVNCWLLYILLNNSRLSGWFFPRFESINFGHDISKTSFSLLFGWCSFRNNEALCLNNIIRVNDWRLRSCNWGSCGVHAANEIKIKRVVRFDQLLLLGNELTNVNLLALLWLTLR